MINTFSKFHYGIEITTDNKYFDFNEGSGELTATLRVGNYTYGTIAEELEYQLETSGTQGYTVSVNRDTGVITIAAAGAFSILGSTGTNASSGCYTEIGFTATDHASATSHNSTLDVGLEYYPQYKLQDYVSGNDNQSLRNDTVMTSASGKCEVISFGTDNVFEFSIKFATDIFQPSNGPINNNQTGVADLRSLMEYLINKYEVEFYPDIDDGNDFYRVVLESTSADSKGTGFKLEEQYARGLVGYYESGLLKFRVIEE